MHQLETYKQHKKIKHLNTRPQDANVSGSPQTRGYIHQMVASCDIIY